MLTQEPVITVFVSQRFYGSSRFFQAMVCKDGPIPGQGASRPLLWDTDNRFVITRTDIFIIVLIKINA